MASAAKWVLALWMPGVLAATYFYLPDAQGFPRPDLARIVAIHLPNALVAVVAAITAAYFGWRYLVRGRDLLDDIKSKTAAALAALFCVLTTVTGSVFARVQWGEFWNWDPKQTCIVLLLLIYGAYFVLRAGIEDEEKRAAVGAVYVLFAAIMTPMLGYVIPKYLPSLHPTNTSFAPEYRMVLLAASAGFLGMYCWMQNLAVRAERVRLALEREAAYHFEEGAGTIPGAEGKREGNEALWTR